jgi:cell division protein FtsB
LAKTEKILFSVFLTLVVGFIAYSLLSPSSGKQAHLKKELAQLESQNQKLELQNKRLRLEIKALKTRKEYIEQTAREELGLVKADEIVIQLPKGTETSTQPKNSQQD